MNKAYLKSLATYQCVNMAFYLILSAMLGNGSLGGAGICFILGIFVHKYFSWNRGN